jgi:hypothetical protein
MPRRSLYEAAMPAEGDDHALVIAGSITFVPMEDRPSGVETLDV